jgi:uncharacterized protein YeaO (DUF488 family)
MSNFNSSLVTGELFLDIEAVLHKKTCPTFQTILALNEILEAVVLRNSLLMSSSDHILIMKNLNREEIAKLEGNDKVDWAYEMRNLGSANLINPAITNYLYEKGILILDTEQEEDSEFRHFGEKIFAQQSSGNWLLKAIGFGTKNLKEKRHYELSFIRGFNNTVQLVSSNPEYWRMAIKAAPWMAKEVREKRGFDYEWVHTLFEEVGIYLSFVKQRNLDFSDNPFMQPFIALQSGYSEDFASRFYEELKKVRDEEIERLLDLADSWYLYLPPLTVILLQRCKRMEDLPAEIVKLRDEFQDLRTSFSDFQEKYHNAQLIKEKMELKKDFLHSVEVFRAKIKHPKRRIIKTLLDFSVQHSGNMIMGNLTDPVKAIARKALDLFYERKLFPWIHSFADLYERSLEIKENSTLFGGLFGPMDTSNLKEYELFAKNSLELVSK